MDQDWLLVERTPRVLRKPSIYGTKSNKTFIKYYNKKQPKNLVFPRWTDINILDKTVTAKKVKSNSKFEIVPKYNT